MPSITAEPVSREAERAELQAVLQSPLFARSPTLTHLLSYLCEKAFAGESEQIKEYSVAVDVFGRPDSFEPDADSIVRVQANRLRKRLADYYALEGADHSLRIVIPVGQYVPVFEQMPAKSAADMPPNELRPAVIAPAAGWPRRKKTITILSLATAVIIVAAIIVATMLVARQKTALGTAVRPVYSPPPVAESPVGLPAGEEIRILAGTARKYVDHAGKLWNPDSYFTGGTAVQGSVTHIWRTQDPIIYRNSRQGDFTYDIPLKPGVYELHLHFAETFYGPEDAGGGGEGSRTITVRINGQLLLSGFDVLADAGGDRTADVKICTGISPAADGRLHLSFSSANGAGMVSAIEILPGIAQRVRPVRIVARDVPYYSNDSHWWSPDVYFKGGQLGTSQEPASDTDDPEFYETERWGHFSYAIPVAPGRYTVTLYFIEHRAVGNVGRAIAPDASSNSSPEDRRFNVFCNGKIILANLNIRREAGENHPLERRIKGLEPDAQGKLVLDFVPVTGYATVTAIEVVQE